ncbi:AglZ/HisF2 family acetamidino modification protein [Pseudorhizobium pelagicum]|uniref:Imidazole glycerol phosphate synthase subunit HisF n=1 Tax=Pseudorhizobium pelagicum TaxID=1509405 RepID=A0A922P0C0_9HYPH|nr:AglZ/HisF2 family acetamidino modification protein [Pseudorhizobium pelagicum]KEQ02449.1 imidazole glycerol phosphate synthase [Pseudorhizobium pelagicum]KEQ02462.1 imidazole glycerol phosphate synthase [Pseudorhizobium pelagicum]
MELISPRIIPVLLMDRSRRLVKTVGFRERTYIGDPFNVVRIFNEKEVDEICLIDIDATADGRDPDLGFVREFASECFMPLSYGGGLKEVNVCEALHKVGVEKLVIGTQAPEETLVRELATSFGSQAVVVSIDVHRGTNGTEVRILNGTRRVDQDPLEFAQRMVQAGAGEILLNSIDNDGARTGYDLELIRQFSKSVPVPLIALGGAGEHVHLRDGLSAGASAVASGSAFTFQGPLRAVLITYPTPEEIDTAIIHGALTT